MRCLFLPENLAAILYEEQRLLQTQLKFRFKKTIPLFATGKNYTRITIFPPVEKNGLIIRPCNAEASSGYGSIEGFILGDAGEDAHRLLSKIEYLKTLSKLPVFSQFSAKSWYFADTQITEDLSTGLCSWKIQNPKWCKSVTQQ